MLSERRFVLGLDGSADVIATANASCRRSSNLFTSIEHVADGAGFFATLCRALKPGGNLIFSTPCEERLPHAGCANHFHHRHYTLAETLQLVQSHGLELVSHAGQDCYRMTPEGPASSPLFMPAADLNSTSRPLVFAHDQDNPAATTSRRFVMRSVKIKCLPSEPSWLWWMNNRSLTIRLDELQLMRFERLRCQVLT